MNVIRPYEIVIRGEGDSADLEKKVLSLVESGELTAEYRDVGGPNPQVRRIGGEKREVPTLTDLKQNKHGEGYAAAAPPPLKIVGVEEQVHSNGPISPSPVTMAANDGVTDGGKKESDTDTGDTDTGEEDRDENSEGTDTQDSDAANEDEDEEDANASLSRDSFHEMNTSEVIGLLEGTSDRRTLNKLGRWESANPKHEGGRVGVNAAIQKRLAELDAE